MTRCNSIHLNTCAQCELPEGHTGDCQHGPLRWGSTPDARPKAWIRRYNEAYSESYPEAVWAENMREARSKGIRIDKFKPHVEADKIADEVATAWADKGDTP